MFYEQTFNQFYKDIEYLSGKARREEHLDSWARAFGAQGPRGLGLPAICPVPSERRRLLLIAPFLEGIDWLRYEIPIIPARRAIPSGLIPIDSDNVPHRCVFCKKGERSRIVAVNRLPLVIWRDPSGKPEGKTRLIRCRTDLFDRIGDTRRIVCRHQSGHGRLAALLGHGTRQCFWGGGYLSCLKIGRVGEGSHQNGQRSAGHVPQCQFCRSQSPESVLLTR